MEKRPIILAADDEEPILKLLRVNLSKQGYHVITACDGISALKSLEEYDPDLAILDIMMPGKSGVELLPEIKARFPDTGVIMATAISDTAIAINCMKEGAYDYLTKPFDINGLLLTVARAMERRKLKIENRNYREHLQEKVEEQAEKIRTSFLSAVTALALALEAKDEYTNGHSQRVAEISAVVAGELGMLRDGIEKIRLAGLVHDIGKIGIAESILGKPGTLNDEELHQIRHHCEKGERILIPIVEDEEILKIVRHHHERYDGKGYPDGLSDEQIPLGARILAVADSFDAMTSERPYRKAMSIKDALCEIEHCRRTQFDPTVVNAFLRVYKSQLQQLILPTLNLSERIGIYKR